MFEKNKIINILVNKYMLIIIALLLGISFIFSYLSLSTRDVPFYDSYHAIVQFVEKIMTGNFKFIDLWPPHSGHTNPLATLIFFINIYYFNYNVLIGVYGGLLFTFFISVLIIAFYIKENVIFYSQSIKSKFIIQILSIIFIFAIFNLNQWEILTLEYSLPFKIRIFIYLFIFAWLNHCLINNKRIYIVSIFIGLVSPLLSQGYFFALIGSIIILALFHICIKYENGVKILYKEYLFLLSSIIIAVLLFFINFEKTTTLNSLNRSDFSIISFIVNFIKGCIVMFGSSIMNHFSDYPFFNIKSHTIIYVTGIIISFLYIISIIIYFYRKMYLKTYMPIFLFLYCFINIVLIIYTRAFQFDVWYLSASRYVVETTIGIIGIIWILGNEIIINKNIFKLTYKMKTYIIIILLLFITICITLSSFKEYKIAPYRGYYYDNLIKILLDIDQYPDEELNKFQDPPNIVRAGASILKKYNLSVYKNYKYNENNVILNGFFTEEVSGRWINGNASITVKDNNTAKILYIDGYYPEYMPENKLFITVNNNEKYIEDIIPGKNFNIELEFINYLDKINIIIRTEKSYIPKNERWNNDERELGVFITSWKLSDGIK